MAVSAGGGPDSSESTSVGEGSRAGAGANRQDVSAGGGPDSSESTSVGEGSRAGAGANHQAAASPFAGKYITLAATGLGLFMIFLDAMVVNVALPDIQHDFGGGEADLQWIVAAYTLADGRLDHDRGRRSPTATAAAASTSSRWSSSPLASAACGVAPGPPSSSWPGACRAPRRPPSTSRRSRSSAPRSPTRR